MLPRVFFDFACGRRRWVLAFNLLLATIGAAHAQTDATAEAPLTDPKHLEALQSFEEVLSSPGVVRQHPDLRYRQLAMEAYRHGDMDRALKMFMRAASYADKPSQAAVAEMYWEGVGAPQDRPRAYAWMDLAATRGYDRFMAKREYYWGQLTEAERKQALRVGQDIFAEYDDKVALHRLRLELDHVRMNVTGSRVGTIGAGKVYVYGGGMTTAYNANALPWMELSEFYRPSVWKIDDYAKMKDLQWKVRVEDQPSVEVGDLQKVPASEPPPAK
jgi:hypothetical protein